MNKCFNCTSNISHCDGNILGCNCSCQKLPIDTDGIWMIILGLLTVLYLGVLVFILSH